MADGGGFRDRAAGGVVAVSAALRNVAGAGNGYRLVEPKVIRSWRAHRERRAFETHSRSDRFDSGRQGADLPSRFVESGAFEIHCFD